MYEGPRSSIILPALVRDEIVQKQREKISTQISKVEKEIRELNRYLVDNLTFHAPFPDIQTRNLRALLRRPSERVRTKFLAEADGVDLKEVIRRGVKRIPPASSSGEELRDVILWLIVLSHARTSGRPTSFVTADTGFWDLDKPKVEIQHDIDSLNVKVRLYRDLAEFTKANALRSEPITAEWIHAHLADLNLGDIASGP
jgi:hypothetical protein